MAYNVSLLLGDGTGPELVRATRRVLEATGVKFNFDELEVGADQMEKYGTPLPEHVLESIRQNKVALKGPITTPVGTGFRSVNVALRQALTLYANVRPAKSYVGVRSRYTDIDVLIFRENTEDLYAGIEHQVGDDAAESIKIITRKATERLAHFAFDYARKTGRKKIVCVHKANIMKFTDGLFLKVCGEVAAKNPDIEFGDYIVDNCAMQLVQVPEQFDCILTENLYGDILSDLCAGLVGGLGVAPGANIGDGIALFEPVHGSAPKYKGLNKVNPVATILSGKMMLDYLGEHEAATRLEKAVADVLAEGKNVTYDLKQDRSDPSAVGTSQMADAIISRLK